MSGRTWMWSRPSCAFLGTRAENLPNYSFKSFRLLLWLPGVRRLNWLSMLRSTRPPCTTLPVQQRSASTPPAARQHPQSLHPPSAPPPQSQTQPRDLQDQDQDRSVQRSWRTLCPPGSRTLQVSHIVHVSEVFQFAFLRRCNRSELSRWTESQLSCSVYKDLDECKNKILPQQTRYGIQNQESTTLYHCNCTTR